MYARRCSRSYPTDCHFLENSSKKQNVHCPSFFFFKYFSSESALKSYVINDHHVSFDPLQSNILNWISMWPIKFLRKKIYKPIQLYYKPYWFEVFWPPSLTKTRWSPSLITSISSTSAPPLFKTLAGEIPNFFSPMSSSS